MSNNATDYIIVNPLALGGCPEKYIDKLQGILRQNNIKYMLEYSKYAGAPEGMAKEAAGRFDKIWAVGGDGTVSEIASGIIGSKSALAIVPAGTGNDFVKTIGIPSGFEEAVNVAINGKAKLIDVVECNDSYFINVGGMGFDANVAAGVTTFSKKGFKGKYAYYMSLLKELFTLKPVKMTINADNCKMECECIMVDIGNGRFIGGGIEICPKANPFDGELDVCVVHDVPMWRIPLILPDVVKGKHLRLSKYCTYFNTKNITVNAAKQVNIQLDGQISQGGALKASIASKMLAVVVP